MKQLRSLYMPGLQSIKGSTKDILIGLYQLSMKAEDVPAENPHLHRLVAMDARTAAIGATLAQPSRLKATQDAVSAGLRALETTTVPVIRKLFQGYSQEFGGNLPQINQTLTNRESLLEQYKQLVSKQHSVATDILSQIKTGKNVDNSKILELEEETKRLGKSLAVEKTNEMALLPKLDRLHSEIYHSLPDTDRATMIPPSKDEAKRIRPS